MTPEEGVSAVYLQNQINDLRETCATLAVVVEKADGHAGENRETMMALSAQVQRMDGTMLRMRADLPTKDELNEALNVTLNRYIAKGFWSVLIISTGAAVTWMVNHLTFKG